MKFFTKLATLALAATLIVSATPVASAANIDKAKTNANSSASLLAADFEVSGTRLSSDIQLPSYYSSRDEGLTTSVKNQLYNTCWAYGSLSTLETFLLKNRFEVSDFAPIHMNHWGTTRSDSTGWLRDQYAGGYSYISLGYFSSWQGPVLNSDYPQSTSISDFSLLNESIDKQYAVNEIIYLDTNDVETIKTAVYNYGAVVGNYHVNDSCYNSATNSYYCNIEGLLTSQLNGHCISVVGWDDNYSKENFVSTARPENDGAWLCKNSWGDSWGDGGYYWISYEDVYLFGTQFGHSYVFTDVEPFRDVKMLYQNETDGATYEFEYVENYDTITYINVFDVTGDYDIIEEVNFETTSNGADYVIYQIPLMSTGKPVSRQAQWVEIGSGTVEYQGYHSVDTKDFEVTGDKFAIGVQLTKNGASTNTIGVDEWLSVTGGDYIFVPQSQYGMSYLVCGNTAAIDVMDFYKDKLEDEIGGTFVIKAIGSNIETIQGDVDFDSKVTILDATLIQLHLAQIQLFSKDQLKIADFDGDSEISIFDATGIQYRLAGLDNSYTEPDDYIEI